MTPTVPVTVTDPESRTTVATGAGLDDGTSRPRFDAALRLRLFIAFEIADVAVFVTRFSWFGLLDGRHSGLAGAPFGAFKVAILVRAVILVLCVIAWVRGREEAPALAEPVAAPVPGDVRQPVPV